MEIREGWIGESMDGGMDGCMSVWMGGWMAEWMDGWMDGLIERRRGLELYSLIESRRGLELPTPLWGLFYTIPYSYIVPDGTSTLNRRKG